MTQLPKGKSAIIVLPADQIVKMKIIIAVMTFTNALTN